MSAGRVTQELPEGLLEEGEGRKLHLGGTVRKRGWEVMNALPGDHVDHEGDVRDLSRFEDATFDVVYASHIVEHMPYQRDLSVLLSSVRRVLAPGGRFFVSVPDLAILCAQFNAPWTSPDDRFALMRMIFGGQLDEYDFHYVGLWDQLLASLLLGAGFTNVFKVPRFGFFEDMSELTFLGQPVSLNMVAVR